jgi:hypothetical protein
MKPILALSNTVKPWFYEMEGTQIFAFCKIKFCKFEVAHGVMRIRKVHFFLHIGRHTY